MAIVYSAYVREALDYAWSIAQLYKHTEVAPPHLLLALLKHQTNGHIRAYIESKVHLIKFKYSLFQELQTLPTHDLTLPAFSESGYALNESLDEVIKEAYTEAMEQKSNVILPEYLFLTLLKYYAFDGLEYADAKEFMQKKSASLIQQHQEINWGRQEAWLSLAKGLDKYYEAGKTPLKPYLHQAYQATTGLVRSFILLIREPQKINKVTIELVESRYLSAAIEQTLRFLNHRKYPLEEVFLYLYDTKTWEKFSVLPKQIVREADKQSISQYVGIDFQELM